MAKELADKKFMEEFNGLTHEEQQKLIDRLDKNKKPKVPGAPEKDLTGASDDWN